MAIKSEVATNIDETVISTKKLQEKLNEEGLLKKENGIHNKNEKETKADNPDKEAVEVDTEPKNETAEKENKKDETEGTEEPSASAVPLQDGDDKAVMKYEELPEEIKNELSEFKDFFEINFNKIEKNELKDVLNYYINQKSEKILKEIAEKTADELITELKKDGYFKKVKAETDMRKIIYISNNEVNIEDFNLKKRSITASAAKKEILKNENIIEAVYGIYASLFEESEYRYFYFSKLSKQSVESELKLFEDVFDVFFTGSF